LREVFTPKGYQVEAHLWWVAGPLAALAGATLIAALRAIPTDL
jgi:hypothetical protein